MQYKMVTTKQCIKLLVHVYILVDIFIKLPIASIEKFDISEVDILPIQHISTPLASTYI